MILTAKVLNQKLDDFKNYTEVLEKQSYDKGFTDGINAIFNWQENTRTNKPPFLKRVLITVLDKKDDLEDDEEPSIPYVTFGYRLEQFWVLTNNSTRYDTSILAWAELPEPYKK